jgi:hypothetical protein
MRPGNVDLFGEHCRFCRFSNFFGTRLLSNPEFKGICWFAACVKAAKVARSVAKTATLAAKVARAANLNLTSNSFPGREGAVWQDGMPVA